MWGDMNRGTLFYFDKLTLGNRTYEGTEQAELPKWIWLNSAFSGVIPRDVQSVSSDGFLFSARVILHPGRPIIAPGLPE